MITSDGIAKIMDFGLAKLSGRTRITRTGTAVGTPAYMSPEQAEGQEVDQRSDIFSFGVILYEMIGGRLPFKGDYEAAVLHSILHDEPEPLSDSRPGIPGQLQRIVSRALEKDEDKRYQSTTELEADLAQLREETRSRVAGKLQKATGRRRYIIPAVAVLAIVVAYVALTMYGPEGGIGSRLKTLLSGDPGQSSHLAREELFRIVVVPFWTATDDAEEEGRVMHGLIEQQLRAELGGEPDVMILSESVTSLPRSHNEATALGEELDATVVIWGEVFSLHGEVEIQPHLTLIKRSMVFWNPTGSRSLDLSTAALEADLSQPSQLALRKEKAEQVSNLGLLAAAYYYGGRDIDRANAILKRIEPRSSMSLLVEAQVAFFRDRRTEAERLCLEAATLDESDPWPYYTLGTMYTKLKRYDEAIASLEKALALDPDQDEFKLHLAIAYAWTGNENALDLYREVVERNPENSMVHVRMGWINTRLSRLEEAIEEHKLAIRLDPENVYAYRGLGYVYELNDSLPKAVECYKRGKELAPSNEFRAVMCWFLGRAYMREEKHDEAVAEFSNAIDLRPSDPIFYMVMLRSYRDMGRGEEGLGIVKEAVREHPEDAQFLEVLAGSYVVLRRPNEAIAAYKEVIRLNPDLGDAYVGMGNAYMQLDSLDASVSNYRKARNLGTLYYGYHELSRDIARAYLAQGKWDDGVEEIQRGLQVRRDDWALLAWLGVTYMCQGKYNEAIGELKEAIKVVPDNFSPYLHLFYSISLQRLGRPAEGRQYIRELAEEAEGDSWEISLVRFLAGDLSESALLAKAEGDDPRIVRGRKCEAHYFVGMAYLLDTDAELESIQPDVEGARAHLERCVATGIWRYAEYSLARAELGRLPGGQQTAE
jgi:tetratricopeptide (TPR) repeat protein